MPLKYPILRSVLGPSNLSSRAIKEFSSPTKSSVRQAYSYKKEMLYIRTYKIPGTPVANPIPGELKYGLELFFLVSDDTVTFPF
jgi:hypothetical protein